MSDKNTPPHVQCSGSGTCLSWVTAVAGGSGRRYEPAGRDGNGLGRQDRDGRSAGWLLLFFRPKTMVWSSAICIACVWICAWAVASNWRNSLFSARSALLSALRAAICARSRACRRRRLCSSTIRAAMVSSDRRRGMTSPYLTGLPW